MFLTIDHYTSDEIAWRSEPFDLDATHRTRLVDAVLGEIESIQGGRYFIRSSQPAARRFADIITRPRLALFDITRYPDAISIGPPDCPSIAMTLDDYRDLRLNQTSAPSERAILKHIF